MSKIYRFLACNENNLHMRLFFYCQTHRLEECALDGSVHYFVNRLTASLMNRLVNEQAYSLDDCYKQLVKEIASSKEMATQYQKNLDKAYQLVLAHFMDEEKIFM